MLCHPAAQRCGARHDQMACRLAPHQHPPPTSPNEPPTPLVLSHEPFLKVRNEFERLGVARSWPRSSYILDSLRAPCARLASERRRGGPARTESGVVLHPFQETSRATYRRPMRELPFLFGGGVLTELRHRPWWTGRSKVGTSLRQAPARWRSSREPQRLCTRPIYTGEIITASFKP